jgi:hypothetical protein
MTIPIYEPRTSYRLDEGGKVARPVTTYALRLRRLWQEFDAAKVEAYDTSGKPVEAKKVAELLTKETPVLVSADGQKVDPFHLRVIKRGTLVLVVPQPETPPPAEPPLAPPTPVRE